MAKTILGSAFVLVLGTDSFGCSQDVSLTITTESTDTVGCREDAQVAGGTGLVPTTTKPTGYGWSVTSSALFRFGENATEAGAMVTIPELQKIQLAGTALPFSFKYDDPNSTYSATYSGQVYVTDSTLNAALDGDASGEFTFTGSGPLTIVETPVTP
jgi:hypothetical protein